MKSSALARLASDLTSRARPTWGDARRARCIAAADQYPIEDGIPIPPRRARVGLRPQNEGMTEAVRRLKPGQSVLLPTTQGGANALAHRFIGAGQYATRVVHNGTRVWRTK